MIIYLKNLWKKVFEKAPEEPKEPKDGSDNEEKKNNKGGPCWEKDPPECPV